MAHFPYPCLVADVGGTNARFALVSEPDGALSPMVRLTTAAEPSFADTVEKAVQEAGWPRPKSFLLAVAGPIAGRTASLTNAQTTGGALAIDGPQLADVLQLDQGLLLNDFEALCLSLPFLGAAALTPLSAGLAVPGEPMLVVGPGTGLGVGALLQKDGVWLPVASEGGHVALGPRTPEEFKLWPHLRDQAISAEDLLSGRGLARLHSAVRSQMDLPTIEADAALTSALALAGDASAGRAVQHFFAILARLAGDMTLAFCARGGVFIGGGIAPRFLDVLDTPAFARSFAEKGRASAYLDGIPVKLITASDAALQGLAALSANPARFAINYSERCWR